MSKQELYDIIADLGAQLVKARDSLAQVEKELKWYRDKLAEAETRNRQLDWALTRMAEEVTESAGNT
jgi:phage shock protein A